VEVIFTPLAERHHDRLHQYITSHASEDRADAYLGCILDFCKSLATFLMRGTPRDDLLSGLRVTGFERRVTIAFAVTKLLCSSKEFSMAAATSRRHSVSGTRMMIPTETSHASEDRADAYLRRARRSQRPH
jgi:toxin ParE1/3/4